MKRKNNSESKRAYIHSFPEIKFLNIIFQQNSQIFGKEILIQTNKKKEKEKERMRVNQMVKVNRKVQKRVKKKQTRKIKKKMKEKMIAKENLKIN